MGKKHTPQPIGLSSYNGLAEGWGIEPFVLRHAQGELPPFTPP